MKHYRIPTFTGVEAQRDDADRGTLRLAEGCVLAGPGGLRSPPVFVAIGTVSNYSSTANNTLSKAVDSAGNSVMFASRNSEIHDVRVYPVPNTEVTTLAATTLVR